MTSPTNNRVSRALTPPSLIGRMVLALTCAVVLSAGCDVHSFTDPGALASVTVTPNITMAVTSTQQFAAVGADADDLPVAITPVWSVIAGGGTISATGLFTAGNTPGVYNATVQATSGGMSGTANVTVIVGVLATIAVTPDPDTLNQGATRQFTAVGRDAGNNIVAITPTWSVTNGGGAINGSGLFTAGATLGSFSNTVRATNGSVFGTATVVVQAGALATITVTPDPDTLNQGATRQFTAVGRDAGNNIIPITPVWSVMNSGGAINPSGLFTAGGVDGTFLNTVRATSGATFGTATVVVDAAFIPPPVIPLGLVAPYGIMAGLSFTCINNGLIQSDIAISPGSTVTGFPPCVITGVQHLADATALNAQNDLTSLYNTLAGLPCPPANAIVADLGGTTKPAGVYCTATGINVTGVLTLDGGGDSNASFVFQAGSSLVTAGDIVLINGAQAKNVFWQVDSSATLGTASQFKGNVVVLTSVTLVDNANLIGRALARNGSVSLGTGNTITLP
jgi:ice-binding like protein